MSTSVLFQSNSVSPHLRIAERLKKANISIIKEMMYLAEEEKKKGKEIVSLGVGIPFYPIPQSLRTNAIDSLTHKPDIDKYSFFAGLPKLRQRIAQEVTKTLGLKTTENAILVTPGNMAALLYSAMALVNPGDEVIVPSPYFASYAQQITLAGGMTVEVPMIEPKTKTGSFQLDLEAIEKRITRRTKAIIINSPHNPTGSVFEKNNLLGLADIIAKKKIYVITDEVYEFLLYDNTPHFNIAGVKKLWPYVIRCYSYSKKFGMTGWRIGYLHTNPELLKYMLKIHDNTIVCAPHIAQETVYEGLMHEPGEMRINRSSLQKNRDLVCKRLDMLSDLFSYVIPRGAYYIFPKIKMKMSSVDFALKLLYEAGVIVTPGIGFGKAGEGHVRMSFGGTEDEINRAFDKIELWSKKYI